MTASERIELLRFIVEQQHHKDFRHAMCQADEIIAWAQGRIFSELKVLYDAALAKEPTNE